MNQLIILLKEGNVKAAFDLYKFGKNANAVSDEIRSENKATSLQMMARNKGNKDTSNDKKRLYKMYEKYFNGEKFADSLVSDQFQYGAYPEQTIPIMIETIVTPQYAMRSFFAAFDACETNETVAEALWDQGAAVLAGSIEGENALGNKEHNGLSWLALGYEFCHIFHCGDGDFENPKYRRHMMNNVKFGRDYLRAGRCSALHNNVIEMESLLITPILQGLLFHTFMLSTAESEERRARVFAYGMAAIPFIRIASKEDATIIEQSLFNKDSEFTENHAKLVWTFITLSLSSLGVDCDNIGKDTFGLLGKDESFCHLVNEMTQFPTPAPVPTIEPIPTGLPTPEPTSNPTPTAQAKAHEISPAFMPFFRADHVNDATEM